MLTDIDKEFDTPEIDENGELIEVIEEEDIFVEEDLGLEEQPDSFYEVEDDIVIEGEEEEEFDNIQEVTVEAKENYENAKEQLVAIFTSILEKGEITAEDNVEIEQVKEQYSEAYNSIKENTEVIQKKTLEERVQELADGMVGATTDEILNILTDDGRKPWLYKDDDGNVLMDGTAIPELTVLVQKLNLIATDGENEGEIQLTPNFINMVVKDTGAGNSVNKIVNKYYLSTSKTELIGGTWVDVLPTPSEQEGKFLWIKTVTTFLDKDKLPQETTPICISGQDGSNGKDGLNGADGVDGKDGVSLIYKGEFTAHPSNPQNGWYYRNTTEGKTFVYQDDNWYQMTVDGQDGLNGNNGKDGLSIEYKGELSSPPSNPVKNWTYKDSDNGVVYIYTGLAWEVMTYDGSNGQDGANGQNGLSIFVTYNDSATQPATPTGNGTTNGWHTNVTSSVIWMSQKVASSSTTGTWGVPIKIQGKDGQDGASVQEVIIQYSKNTSTINAPADGWGTSMPSYQEGYFLWIRTRIKYSNNANYVYSTPICDQSWKANAEVYTQYKQLKEKFSWIVKSGTSESNMELTDALFKVLTETISLTAKNINLNGYISNDGGNFALDQQGNMDVQDLRVKGELYCTNLAITTFNNPKYPEALDGSMNINIDETNGNDDIELEDGATFQTIGGFFNKCPKNLNGRTINVSFKTDITENVSSSYFYCGRIRFYCEGHKISGWVRIESIPTLTQMFGGSVEDPYGAIGSIMPYIGLNQGGVSASFVNYGSVNTSLYNMKVYKAANLASGCTESVAVASGNNGYTYVSNVTPINCEYGFRTNSHGRIHSDSSGGKASKYGFISVSGGYITLSNGSHTGGTKDNTYFSSGGQVIPGSGATFVGTAESGSNTSTTVNTTKSVTYTSNSGNTYRTTYSSWRNDGGVIQGNAYGSGNCIGYWFFGSQFLDLKGCSEISKVVLKVNRLKIGAWSSKLSLMLGFHNQTGKQTTPYMPAYFQSTDIGAYSGDYVSITITNQTVLDRIKAGTLKGFALYDSNFASGSYGGCSGTAKVTITYKE